MFVWQYFMQQCFQRKFCCYSIYFSRPCKFTYKRWFQYCEIFCTLIHVYYYIDIILFVGYDYGFFVQYCGNFICSFVNSPIVSTVQRYNRCIRPESFYRQENIIELKKTTILKRLRNFFWSVYRIFISSLNLCFLVVEGKFKNNKKMYSE